MNARKTDWRTKMEEECIKTNKTPTEHLKPMKHLPPAYSTFVDYLGSEFVHSSLDSFFLDRTTSQTTSSQKEQLMERLEHAIITSSDPFGRFTSLATAKHDIDRSTILPFTLLVQTLSDLICHYFDTTMKRIVSNLTVEKPWRLSDEPVQNASVRFIVIIVLILTQ